MGLPSADQPRLLRKNTSNPIAAKVTAIPEKAAAANASRSASSTEFSSAPVLLLDSRKYRTAELTEFNFRIRDDRSLSNGQNYAGRLVRSDADYIDVEFRTRLKGDGQVYCRFGDLSLETKQALNKFVNRDELDSRKGDSLNELSYDQIASGPASEQQQKKAHLISRMKTGDSPQPSAKPAAAVAEKEEKGASGRMRTIAALLLIAAIVIIFLIVGAFISARNQVSIRNSALVGNYLPVQSGSEGVVSNIYVTEGQMVSAGDPLFQVHDKTTETEIAFANADLLEARAAETAYKHQLKSHHKKLEIVADNLEQRLLGAMAELKKARLESAAQGGLLKNKQKLFDRGLLSNLELSTARTKHAVMLADVDSKKAAVGMLEVAFRATTENGIIAIGDVLEDELGELKAGLMVAEANVDRAEAQLTAISRNNLQVTAQTDGRVYAVYRQNGEFVKQADSILSVSLNDNYWASGSISSQEADRIRPGQKVRVQIPSLDLEVTGEVAAVGHRGLYTAGGWSQDFRSAALDVPLKVRLLDMPEEVPSGLRLKMSVNLGFKWPWQDEDTSVSPFSSSDENTALSTQSVKGSVVMQGSVTAIGPVQLENSRATSQQRSWAGALTKALVSQLQSVPGTKVDMRGNDRINIQVGSGAGFDSGAVQLSSAGENTMRSIASILAQHKDAHIRISGHTDNRLPVSNTGYADNKALSAARATTVMNYLSRAAGIPEYRMSAVGQADLFPIASNLSADGRSLNRRIEIDLTRRFKDTG